MKKIGMVLLCLLLLITGCRVKQNRLVEIDDGNNGKTAVEGENKAPAKQTPSPVPGGEAVQVIPMEQMKDIPLGNSPAHEYSLIFRPGSFEENAKGIPRTGLGHFPYPGKIVLKKLSSGEEKVLGDTAFVSSLQWDNSGKKAVLAAADDVYVVDLEKAAITPLKLDDKVIGRIRRVSWSPDGRILYMDTETHSNVWAYDVVAGEPLKDLWKDKDYLYYKAKLGANQYVVSKRTVDNDSVFYLYDTEKKELSEEGLVGLYMDSEDSSFLFRQDFWWGSRLYVKDEKTNGQSGIYEGERVYSAKFDHGDVYFTTYNQGSFWLHIRWKDGRELKDPLPVSGPDFWVGEDHKSIYFGPLPGNQEILMVDNENRSISSVQQYQEENEFYSDINQIWSTMNQAVELYRTGRNTLDMEEKLKKVFTNTDAPIPQQALDNLTVQVVVHGRLDYGMELVNDEFNVADFQIHGDRARVILDQYFYNVHELVKKDGRWYITGFSTWPDSKERGNTLQQVEEYLDYIRSGNESEAIRPWYVRSMPQGVWEKNGEFLEQNRTLVESLLAKRDNITLKVGEIEFWAANKEHRVPPSVFSNEARVKITIYDKTTKESHTDILLLARDTPGEWRIMGWIQNVKDLWKIELWQ